jgi:flagellar protein FlaG
MKIERIEIAARELAAVRSAPVAAPAPVPQPAQVASPAATAVITAPQPAPSQAHRRDGAAPEAEAQQRFLSAARQLREALGPMANTAPRFQADPSTNQVLVEIVDETSGEVVRRIPEETILKFAESWDAYLGTLVDKEA